MLKTGNKLNLRWLSPSLILFAFVGAVLKKNFNKDVKPDDKVKRSQVLHYICLPSTVDPRNQNPEK